MANRPTPSSIRKRLQEFREIGREPFLRKYASGFGARTHFIRYRGKSYDMKAVWAAAHEPRVWSAGFNTSEPHAELPRMGFKLITAREAARLKNKDRNDRGTLHIVHGDSVRDRDDLVHLAKTGKQINWIVPSRAVVGDEIVVFVNSSFFATAKITSDPRRRKSRRNRYGAMIGHVKLVVPPISIGIIREEIRGLHWAKYPRSIHTPGLPVAKKIKRLISGRAVSKGLDVVKKGATSSKRAKLSYSELKHLALAHAKPSLKKRIGRRIYRQGSAIVHEFVLRRADGICEGCNYDAPFLRPNGMPYLEPHHTLHRADDGPDHPSTIIALCPNCHSRIHRAQDGKTFNANLKRLLRTTIKKRDEQLSN